MKTESPTDYTKLSLKELSQRIYKHLARFEKDPKINKKGKSGLSDYYNCGVCDMGRYVSVRYVGYQDFSHLSKAQAAHYLKMLDKGFVGSHWRAFEKFPLPKDESKRVNKYMTCWGKITQVTVDSETDKTVTINGRQCAKHSGSWDYEHFWDSHQEAYDHILKHKKQKVEAHKVRLAEAEQELAEFIKENVQ